MNDIDIVQLDDFRKQHIAVLCLPGLESFLSDIVEHLKQKYSVRTCYSNSLAEMEEVVGWADAVFLEWGNELTVEVTNKIKALEDKKVILRIHSYEVLSGYLPAINWRVIDQIIFVAKHIKDIAVRQLPGLLNPALNPPEMIIVPNGVRVE